MAQVEDDGPLTADEAISETGSLGGAPSDGGSRGPMIPIPSPGSWQPPPPSSIFQTDTGPSVADTMADERADLYGLGLPGSVGFDVDVSPGGPGVGLYVGDTVYDRPGGTPQTPIVPYQTPNTRPMRPTEPISMGLVRDQWFRMSRSARAQWQQRLKAAGFIAEDPLVWGLPNPDQSDYRGWISAATYAARMGTSIDQVLTMIAQQRGPEEEEGPTRRMPDITITNAADARKIAEEVGKELIGKTPSKDQIDRAVKRLRSLETGAGRQAQQAAMSEEGGAVLEGAPSPATAIEDSLEAQMPEEVRAHDTADAFATFLGMLGGGQ